MGGSNLSKSGKVRLDKRTYLSWGKYHESPEIKVSINDLVFGQRGTCGNPVMIDKDIGPTTINLSLVLLKSPDVNSQFLCYWLMSPYIGKTIESYLSSTAIPMLSQQQIGNMRLTIPSTSEQRAIAAFLDRETGKLDELIAKQQDLIVLLEEKRQAVISHAVTKGLSALKAGRQAPMKPSGIEWLGDIPEHWEVKSFKHTCTLGPKCQTTHLSQSNTVTFLPMEYVKQVYFIPNTAKLSACNSSYNIFEEGDLIIAKVTPCFENGNIAIATDLSDGVGFGSSELFVIRANNVKIQFIFYYLHNTTFKYQAEASMTGAGGLKRVSADLVKNHHIAVPSPEEQQQIANYLDKQTTKIDKLISKAKSAIELMQDAVRR